MLQPRHKPGLAAIFVVSALLIGVAVAALNPLRRSEASIRENLLKEAPLGSSMDEVLSLIASKGWQTRHVSDTGFDDQRFHPQRIIGAKSIRASLGDYQDLPFKANVTVFWGFDERGSLIDLWVWKTWDGL